MVCTAQKLLPTEALINDNAVANKEYTGQKNTVQKKKKKKLTKLYCSAVFGQANKHIIK